MCWLLSTFLMGVWMLVPEARALTVEVTELAAAVGDYGLRITVDRTCSEDDLVLASGTVDAGSYHACQTLTANDSTVDAGVVEFLAGSTISLGDGFSVATGASFSAGIERDLLPYSFVEDDGYTEPEFDSSKYNARYRFRLDLLDPSGSFTNLSGYSSNDDLEFEVVFENLGGGNMIFVRARENDDLFRESARMPVPAGWQEVRFGWSTSPGQGFVFVTIGEKSVGLFDLLNTDADLAYYRWGVVSGLSPDASGQLDLDEFVTWN